MIKRMLSLWFVLALAVMNGRCSSVIDLDRPVITSCGSGVSAATLWLALDALGKGPKSLYDGHGRNGGARDDLPVEPKA